MLKFLNGRADRAHELAIPTPQAEAAKAGHQQRIEEMREGSYVEELRAYAEQMKAIQAAQSRATGIGFVDGFNAMIRPLTAAAIMLFFLAARACWLRRPSPTSAPGGSACRKRANARFNLSRDARVFPCSVPFATVRWSPARTRSRITARSTSLLLPSCSSSGLILDP